MADLHSTVLAGAAASEIYLPTYLLAADYFGAFVAGET